MDIGRTCPRYQQYGVLYTGSTAVQKALCEYFVILVQLCQHSVLFLRKPVLSQLASSIATPFESNFGTFEKTLLRLATSSREAISLASEQAKRKEGTLEALEREENARFRNAASSFWPKVNQELADFRSWKQRQLYLHFLDACSSYNHETAWKQARKRGTTDWVCRRQEYKDWKTAQVSYHFQCTGILGSGKTVLSANIIDDLRLTIPNAVVAYFFCRYDEAISLKARTVIGSLTRQLIEATTLVYDESMGDSSTTIAHDKDRLLRYLKRILPKSGNTYFIALDGVDECNESDARGIFSWLQELRQACSCFKFYCSNQPNFNLQDEFPWPRLTSVPMSENSEEIAYYIEAAIKDCLQTGQLSIGDLAIKSVIHDALVQGAQGMFLWVTFQPQSICSQRTDADIIKTLQTLPKDLPDTFNRVLEKISQSGMIDVKLCKSILSLW